MYFEVGQELGLYESPPAASAVHGVCSEILQKITIDFRQSQGLEHAMGGPEDDFGGRNRARTCDPLLVRQVLCQLSYSPEVSSPERMSRDAGMRTQYPAASSSGARVIEPFDNAT